MIARLARMLRRGTQVPSADLKAFIAAESAFITQRNSFEYCRARAGLNWQALFSERQFRDALEICRWTAYPAVLSDVLVVVAGRLGNVEVAAAPLTALYADVLADQSRAAGRTDDWTEAVAAFAARLAATDAAPRPPDEIARTGARVLFDALPIHPALRGHDREMVVNSIRFGMVGFVKKLDEQFPRDRLATALAPGTAERPW